MIRGTIISGLLVLSLVLGGCQQKATVAVVADPAERLGPRDESNWNAIFDYWNLDHVRTLERHAEALVAADRAKLVDSKLGGPGHSFASQASNRTIPEWRYRNLIRDHGTELSLLGRLQLNPLARTFDARTGTLMPFSASRYRLLAVIAPGVPTIHIYQQVVRTDLVNSASASPPYNPLFGPKAEMGKWIRSRWMIFSVRDSKPKLKYQWPTFLPNEVQLMIEKLSRISTSEGSVLRGIHNGVPFEGRPLKFTIKACLSCHKTSQVGDVAGYAVYFAPPLPKARD